MEKEILLMEQIEKLDLLKRAKRILQEVQTSSFDQIGDHKGWFYQLNVSLGALCVCIQKLEIKKHEK
jgi:hypothetical protein